MDNPQSTSQARVKRIRWFARIFGLLVILLLCIVFVPEFAGRLGLAPPPPGGLPSLSTADAIQFYSMAIILIGLVVGWKWELAGGVITLLPGIIDGFLNPRSVIFVSVIVAPGILFLVCWWWTRSFRMEEKAAERTDSTTPTSTNA